MVDTTSPTDWRKLREFAAVDLTQSYILSWHVEPGASGSIAEVAEGKL